MLTPANAPADKRTLSFWINRKQIYYAEFLKVRYHNLFWTAFDIANFLRHWM